MNRNWQSSTGRIQNRRMGGDNDHNNMTHHQQNTPATSQEKKKKTYKFEVAEDDVFLVILISLMALLFAFAVGYRSNAVECDKMTIEHTAKYAKLNKELEETAAYHKAQMAEFQRIVAQLNVGVCITTNNRICANDNRGLKKLTNGDYTLDMQTDGNLVLYHRNKMGALWASNTEENPAFRHKDYALELTPTNLLIQPAGKRALWKLHTLENGYEYVSMELTASGNLMVSTKSKYGPVRQQAIVLHN